MTPSSVPIAVIGGRGPHGLALHLWMKDRGLEGSYALVDPAGGWLPTYAPHGPMGTVTHLRSPRELDFALGDPARAMTAWRDEIDRVPLANVYSLEDAEDRAFNELEARPSVRARRRDFWRYANDIAVRSGADAHVVRASVLRLEPRGGAWRLHLDRDEPLDARAVVLATGLAPHRYLPEPWKAWWRHLPAGSAVHALGFRADRYRVANREVAVLGSSNLAAWETAIACAEAGARVTLLCRKPNPVERQLPVPAWWLRRDGVRAFAERPSKERLRALRRTPIPRSAVPGCAARAQDRDVRVRFHARVRYATGLWGGVQLQYLLPGGREVAERYDLVIAATGATARIRELPLLQEAARAVRAPVVVGGPARHAPILDDVGRWKNLPPLYPMGSHAFARVGYAAHTLASASVVLPLTMPSILADAHLAGAHRADIDLGDAARAAA